MPRKFPLALHNAIKTLSVLAMLSVSPIAIGSELEAYGNTQTSPSELSRTELRAVFLGRTRTWNDGTPTRLVLLQDGSPLHKKFCRDVLGIFSHQLRAAWARKVYSGTGQAPLVVSSLEEMQSVIENTPGAVGYRYQEQ